MTFVQRTLSAAAVCAVFAAAGGAAHATDTVTKVVDYGTVALPFSQSYGSTFTLPQATGDRFYEDYAFTIPVGSFNSITADFNLGSFLSIADVQARLYAGAPGVVGAAPLTGVTIVQSWSTPISGGAGTLNVIDPTPLSSGSYVLEIRGTVTGSSGGSYSGLLNISPVPEADGLVMALAGLGFLGVAGLRRKPQA